MHLQTDYLVIGAGVTGLCFTDELLTRSDAHITIADQRDAPGIGPLDTERLEIVMRIKRASQAAFENLPRLLGAR